jgi:ribonuclease VapC
LIVVHASALVAIAQREAERDAFLSLIDRIDIGYLSPINYVQAGIILTRRRLFSTRDKFDDWLAGMGLELCEDIELGASALDAYFRYGKGYHPAQLNLGDCFAYALAKRLNAPLLYRGEDFAQTDIRSAL